MHHGKHPVSRCYHRREQNTKHISLQPRSGVSAQLFSKCQILLCLKQLFFDSLPCQCKFFRLLRQSPNRLGQHCCFLCISFLQPLQSFQLRFTTFRIRLLLPAKFLLQTLYLFLCCLFTRIKIRDLLLQLLLFFF